MEYSHYFLNTLLGPCKTKNQSENNMRSSPVRVITDRSNSEYFDEYHCYRTAVQCTAILVLILILLLHYELIMMSKSPSENELKEIKRPHTIAEVICNTDTLDLANL